MADAYIVFPDVLFDALDNNANFGHSRLFLDKLLKEKERVSTIESKRYRGFIANYHWDNLVLIILDILNDDDKEITNKEINLIQLLLNSCDRDGIENYPYVDNFTPLLDLAKDKSDSFNVFIVCNNPAVGSRIKAQMSAQSHFGNYYILNSKEALFRI